MNRKIKKSFRKPQKTFDLRKDFYKRILYIGLCIIPIVLFATDKGTFRLVPLPFVLIGMYHLIIIIGFSQLLIDDFFPPKTVFEKTVKPLDNFIYHLSSVLFFIGLVGLLFEIRTFDNTLQGTTLFWRGGFVGVAVAVLVTIFLKFVHPSVYYEGKRRYTVTLDCLLGCFLFRELWQVLLTIILLSQHRL